MIFNLVFTRQISTSSLTSVVANVYQFVSEAIVKPEVQSGSIATYKPYVTLAARQLQAKKEADARRQEQLARLASEEDTKLALMKKNERCEAKIAEVEAINALLMERIKELEGLQAIQQCFMSTNDGTEKNDLEANLFPLEPCSGPITPPMTPHYESMDLSFVSGLGSEEKGDRTKNMENFFTIKKGLGITMEGEEGGEVGGEEGEGGKGKEREQFVGGPLSICELDDGKDYEDILEVDPQDTLPPRFSIGLGYGSTFYFFTLWK